jgi:hypothetical protein
MLTAVRKEDSLRVVIDGATIILPEPLSFLKAAFEDFAPHTSEGEPEALFYYQFVEPLGFVLTQYAPPVDDPKTVY